MSRMTERSLHAVFTEAIEAESAAGELYERAAAMCGKDTKLAEMFMRLAGQERGHQAELFEAYGEFKRALRDLQEEAQPALKLAAG